MWLWASILMGTAWASGPEDWAALHSGRLSSSLDREPAAARAIYEAVVEQIDDDDPLRGECVYWLGRAAFESGKRDEAIALLGAVDGRSSVAAAARSLRGRLGVQRHLVTTLPAELNLVGPNAQVVPGWSPGMAPIETLVDADRPMLSWPVTMDAVQVGFLAIGLAPTAGRVDTVRMEARSTEVALAVRWVAETVGGGTWLGAPQVLRPGMWQTVSVDLDTLRPRREGDLVLDRSEIGVLILEIAPVEPGAVSTSARVLLRSFVLEGAPSPGGG